MAKINLLPWREAYRKEKKEQFLAILGVVFVITLLVAYGWISQVESDIERQSARNRTLDAEISNLDKQVKEIAELKKVRDDLLARIKVIQDLEGKRPLIVRYFDELVRLVPDGVYINDLSRSETGLKINGIAESYARISTFMRNLDQSEWFKDSDINSVAAAPREGEQANSFNLYVKTTAPNEELAPAAAPAKSKPKKKGGR